MVRDGRRDLSALLGHRPHNRHVLLREEGLIELFTSHWRNRDLTDIDAVIVGVSRGTPRRAPGYRYRVLRSLAPNDRAWNTNHQEEFEQAYLDQLEELGAERILADLGRIGAGKPVVCLCWERLADPGEWCHRRMLADWLHEQTGLVVPELAPGMLRKRPDAPQQALFDYREERG